MALRFLYILFIGLVFAFFVGIGIDTFYQSPQMPEYPKLESTKPIAISENMPDKIEADRTEYEKLNNNYKEKVKDYSINVSIISIIVAILIVVLSIIIFMHFTLIADGFLLGGVFILGYALVRAFISENDIFRFIVITIAFAVVIYVGYFRFIKNKEVNF